MLRLIPLVLGIAAIHIQARIFNNPILSDRDYYDPSAIKVNGTYYMTTRNLNDNQTEKIEIHESRDLINWKTAGYVFNETNFPQWAKKNEQFLVAKIHVINGNYYVCFNAVYNENGRDSIGIAVAPHPLGPYTAPDQPLLTGPRDSHLFSAIANDNGSLYLFWKFNYNIVARQLTSNGLSFASDQTTELLNNNLTWERSYISSPYYLRREDYHYIIYTGDSSCATRSIGVARSRNVLGPYEKLPDPIIVSKNKFIAPGYNGWIKDLDDKSDVIIFNTDQRDFCYGLQINLASVGWNADDWPYIYDY